MEIRKFCESLQFKFFVRIFLASESLPENANLPKKCLFQNSFFIKSMQLVFIKVENCVKYNNYVMLIFNRMTARKGLSVPWRSIMSTGGWRAMIYSLRRRPTTSTTETTSGKCYWPPTISSITTQRKKMSPLRLSEYVSNWSPVEYFVFPFIRIKLF